MARKKSSRSPEAPRSFLSGLGDYASAYNQGVREHGYVSVLGGAALPGTYGNVQRAAPRRRARPRTRVVYRSRPRVRVVYRTRPRRRARVRYVYR